MDDCGAARKGGHRVGIGEHEAGEQERGVLRFEISLGGVVPLTDSRLEDHLPKKEVETAASPSTTSTRDARYGGGAVGAFSLS